MREQTVHGLRGLTVIDSLAQTGRVVFPGCSGTLSALYHLCPIPSVMVAHETMLPEKGPKCPE